MANGRSVPDYVSNGLKLVSEFFSDIDSRIEELNRITAIPLLEGRANWETVVVWLEVNVGFETAKKVRRGFNRQVERIGELRDMANQINGQSNIMTVDLMGAFEAEYAKLAADNKDEDEAAPDSILRKWEQADYHAMIFARYLSDLRTVILGETPEAVPEREQQKRRRGRPADYATREAGRRLWMPGMNWVTLREKIREETGRLPSESLVRRIIDTLKDAPKPQN